MFCQKCGKKLNKGDRFCDSCGTKVEIEEKESTKQPIAVDKPIETAPKEQYQPYPYYQQKSNTGLKVLVIIMGIIILAGVGFGLWYFVIRDSGSENNTNDNSQKEDNIQKEKDTKYIKPVEGKITSDFGYRSAPVSGASTNHSGIDIGVPVGTPVKAMADGTVVAANGGMRGYGNGVFVDHGMINGKHVVSEYGHLSSFNVKVGDKIKQGQVIAKSGNTGTSSGPHLHITIREDKVPVDPKKYLGKFSN